MKSIFLVLLLFVSAFVNAEVLSAAGNITKINMRNNTTVYEYSGSAFMLAENRWLQLPRMSGDAGIDIDLNGGFVDVKEYMQSRKIRDSFPFLFSDWNKEDGGLDEVFGVMFEVEKYIKFAKHVAISLANDLSSLFLKPEHSKSTMITLEKLVNGYSQIEESNNVYADNVATELVGKKNSLIAVMEYKGN